MIKILHIGLLGVALGLITPIQAQPKVWRDLDQAALDAAYDQAVYAPNLEQVLGRYTTNSNTVREQLGEPLRLAYGEGGDESLDVYATTNANAPIFVFIHGGAWKLGVARDNAHAAEAFVAHGVHFVVPDFSPVPDFNGDLRGMVDQLRRALVWLHANAASTFGGNPQRIYLGGFSSGGHLAAVLLTTDWPTYAQLPPNLIKGGLICSGMFDLALVALSSRREYVILPPFIVEELSPQRHLVHLHSPLIVAYGTFESPEFKRQSEEFVAAVQAAALPITLLIGDGYNHFEMIETLANPYGLLGRAALAQIHGSP
jgi:arylformamidase